MDQKDVTTIDAILKKFLKEMDKLQEQYRAIRAEAKHSQAPKNNV
jgi:hypothetical protein